MVHPCRFAQPQGGGGGQIAPVGGQKAQVALHAQGLPGAGLQPEGIGKAHRLHHHPHIVVAVRPLSQHIQGQIQFGVGLDLQDCHETPPYRILRASR